MKAIDFIKSQSEKALWLELGAVLTVVVVVLTATGVLDLMD